MSQIQVAIMMGSKSDVGVMEQAAKMLKDFGVSHEMRVLSAHRTPKDTVEYVEGLKDRGTKVVICGAGMSAALSGVVAAHTFLPVIGVPIDCGFHGLDALLSTSQMPPGVPVAAVAVGKAGAKNAALLALRIMALSDAAITTKLENFSKEQREQILGITL
ncbi:N5-carboxyaminoimidazole ribonucleotide mutase [hydrothermal vent metagenome]|uniref:N5-carboxyaminoimidazole ribonucleotide mutase n=1 Tax=hydrothermal vent metagenome TaxID=652676 RepID=A0A3B1DLY5_9ZZZZ